MIPSYSAVPASTGYSHEDLTAQFHHVLTLAGSSISHHHHIWMPYSTLTH